MARWFLIVGNIVLLAWDGPGEWHDMARGLVRTDFYFGWRLVLGLGIKNVLMLGTIVGLWRNRPQGYVCLATESLHSIVMRYGAFTAIPPSAWAVYWPQLVAPAVDVAFRWVALVYVWRWDKARGGAACIGRT